MTARFLVRRVCFGLLTLVTVNLLTFMMFFGLPRDPAAAMCPRNCDPARVERIRTVFGLDDPKPVQYLRYVRGLVVGRDLGSALGGHCPAPCLGYSYVNGEPVTATVARVLPITVSIVVPAAVLSLGLGAALGLASAMRRDTALDWLAGGVSLTAASTQLYFVGGIMLLLFVYTLELLPYPRYVPITEDPLRWAEGLILPWCALAFLFSAVYARLCRAQLLETMSEDFVRTAEAKGLPRRAVVGRHALRAAITPLLTTAGTDIGSALGGTVITETTFGLHGLGRTAVDAVRDSDLPTIMATVQIAAASVVVVGIAVDVLYTIVDPRVRLR